MMKYSVLLDKRTIGYAYDDSTRTISVDVSGRTGASIYLYCAATTGGAHNVGALLTLEGGAVQPIGTTTIQSENASLNIIEKADTAKGLPVSGKTAGNAAVSLYDNGTLVKTVTSNAAGSWSATFDLAEPVFNNSYHYIYARISGGSLSEPITTEEKRVTYNSKAAHLTKITMYNTGDHGAQETVFDFTQASTATPYFRVWPSRYPTFTFKAEFSGNAAGLTEVYIVTINSAGEKTYVKTVYDEKARAWVGTHNYTSFSAVPVQVGAAYDSKETVSLPYDDEAFSYAMTQYITISSAVESAVTERLQDAYHCGEPSLSADGQSAQVELSYTDPATNQTENLGTYTLSQEPLPENTTPETLAEQGYIPIEDNSLWGKTEYDEHSFSTKYADLKNDCIYTETLQGSRPGDNPGGGMDGWDIAQTGFEFLVGFTPYGLVSDIADPLINSAGRLPVWWTALKGNHEILLGELDVIRTLLESVCKDTGEKRLSPENYEKLRQEADMLEKQINAYRTKGLWLFAGALVANTGMGIAKNIAFDKIGKALYGCKWVKEGSKQIKKNAKAYNDFWKRIRKADVNEGGWDIANNWVQLFTGLGGDVLTGFKGENLNIKLSNSGLPLLLPGQMDNYIRLGYNGNYAALEDLINRVVASFQPCGDPKPGENSGLSGNRLEITGKPATYIADPSGYVYEAVPSNRLSGVTTAISSKDGGVWDASTYDQVSPQITGADGAYYWDVPMGQWRVDFTKDGYRPADTSGVPQAEDGWLPVPPPQLDINVGMVATAAPTVVQAAAYTDRAEIAFSQYMDIASVQRAVSLNGGAVTVTPVDAEYNLEASTQYATRFVLTAADLSDRAITVTVSTGAKNYAGTPLAETYVSPELTAEVRPTGIRAPGAVSVDLHTDTKLTVVLEPDAAGHTLLAETLTPGLVSIAAGAENVITDANGRAVITLVGNFPGSGQIRITEPVSGLSKTVTANIAVTHEEPPHRRR